MQEGFPGLSEEQLRAENEAMKTKLRTEYNAEFFFSNDPEMTDALENRMLRHVIEVEKYYEKRHRCKLFDKIGRPVHFKSPGEIPDDEMEASLQSLLDYLADRAVSVDACSPNVTERELYRFIVEELFQQEVDDVQMPGLIQGFIYDEFHPDPIHESKTTSMDYAISCILNKERTLWEYVYCVEDLRLNEHTSLSFLEMKHKIDLFKAAYDELDLESLADPECEIYEGGSRVWGNYLLQVRSGPVCDVLRGIWEVVMKHDKDAGCWIIQGIRIENIRF